MPPRPTNVVTPTLVADQVYDIVERAILNGELKAGTPLRVRSVAKMVGTSVMPVREAISRLEDAGLAERIPHKGAIVKAFTVTELIDIYDVRKVLESEAAAKGVAKVDSTAIRHMEVVVRRMHKAVAARDVITALELDEEVLRTLYSASGNPVLVNLVDQLWLQCRAYKLIGTTEAFEKDDQSLWEPQGQLVEAARVGDAAAARSISADSLDGALRRLENRLENADAR